MSQAKTESFASVWDAIAETAEEATNLRVRSELMSKLAGIVERNRWTQTEAAKRCGITQPRINDLLRGRLSRFSLDALVNIAAALGLRVHVELDDAARVRRSEKRVVASTRRQQRGGQRSGRKSASSAVVRARAASRKSARTT